MSTRDHWQRLYETRAPTEVSWYAPHLRESLRLIREVAPLDARIIDVGAGASTLVDDLLDAGYQGVTALDVSEAALEMSRRRLGQRADLVNWLVGDATLAPLGRHTFDIWHDRAVFHFLTDERDRRSYVRQVERAVVPGGHVVVATFAPAGPTRCSGLDVMRHDAQSLSHEFGPAFVLEVQGESAHITPTGREQLFTFCRLRKLA